MYIANSLIEYGDSRYRPGDIVPRLDNIKELIELGYVIVAAGGAENYAEPEQEAAEPEQEAAEPEQEMAAPEQEDTSETEQPGATTTPATPLPAAPAKKFGRKK